MIDILENYKKDILTGTPISAQLLIDIIDEVIIDQLEQDIETAGLRVEVAELSNSSRLNEHKKALKQYQDNLREKRGIK